MAKTLKDHEEVCAERMKNIEARFDKIEAKIDKIHDEIDGFKAYFLKFSVKFVGGLILALCATVWAIKV